MNWLDTLRDRGLQAKRTAAPEPSPRQVQPTEPVEIKHVFAQTRAPSENDPGAVEIGFYSVQGDSVVVHDEDGKPTGKRLVLADGEDPKQAAWRLTCAAGTMTNPDFNRHLDYQPLGMA